MGLIQVSLAEEALDRKGIFRRFRVQDQTIFDALFLSGLIKRPQHEAAHCFSSTLEKSGMYPASLNIDAVVRTPSHCVGDLLGSRWLAFGRAFRFVVKKCGEDQANRLMREMEFAYRWREWGRKRFGPVSEVVQGPLWALSDYYGCVERTDPRKLIRMKLKKKEGAGT